jgi:hypothetical protein
LPDTAIVQTDGYLSAATHSAPMTTFSAISSFGRFAANAAASGHGRSVGDDPFRDIGDVACGKSEL